MPNEPYFPLTARPLGLFLAFLVCLVIFHLVFAVFFRLSKLGWKVVDYIWLSVTALSLIGAAFGVRHMLASSQVDGRKSYLKDSYKRLGDEAGFLTGVAVCRKFTRSEFSPPSPEFERVQGEYDDMCRFGRALLSALPKEAPMDTNEIKWPPRPRTTDKSLIEMLSDLDRVQADYTQAAISLEKTKELSERSDGEYALVVISPFLLMLALALRVTKVTGEILLEKA
jgi:hypothetical protein